MWHHDKARRVVEAYVDAVSDGRGVILDAQTLDQPYGWVFFYQNRVYVETGDPNERFGGNAPVVFNRMSGTYWVTGTAHPLAYYLAEYEKTLPSEHLVMPAQVRDRSVAASVTPSENEARVLALAVYQIRILLAGHSGSGDTGDVAVRHAARLAYALHNEALAVLEARHYDVHGAIARIGVLDAELGAELKPLFDKVLQT